MDITKAEAGLTTHLHPSRRFLFFWLPPARGLHLQGRQSYELASLRRASGRRQQRCEISSFRRTGGLGVGSGGLLHSSSKSSSPPLFTWDLFSAVISSPWLRLVLFLTTTKSKLSTVGRQFDSPLGKQQENSFSSDHRQQVMAPGQQWDDFK